MQGLFVEFSGADTGGGVAAIDAIGLGGVEEEGGDDNVACLDTSNTKSFTLPTSFYREEFCHLTRVRSGVAMPSRLTGPDDWLWEDSTPGTRESVRKQAERKWWYVRRLKKCIPDNARTFLELGCAPGDMSAQIVVDTALEPFGVDFSPNADRYLEAMQAVGTKGTLFKEDLFDFNPGRTFDVVGSFGLIEHFEGSALEQVLAFHDTVLSPGGTLLISIPNFTGLPYEWHRLVDQPNLEKHNLKTMNPEVFRYFTERGYNVLIQEYWGVLRVWGVSSFPSGSRRSFLKYPVGAVGLAINAASRGLARIGIHLSGPRLSPFIIFAARKPVAS